MASAQRIPASRSEVSVMDRVMDEFWRHASENGPNAATEAHIPKDMEEDLDAYYSDTCGRTARQVVPAWKGIRKVVWDAREFRVC